MTQPDRVTHRPLIAPLLAVGALCIQTAYAEEGGSLFVLGFENDFFTEQDGGGYTAGWRAGRLTPDLDAAAEGRFVHNLYRFGSVLPYMTKPGYRHAAGWSFGQRIYTPDDLDEQELIEDDVPYAGLLHGTFGVHAWNATDAHSWELTLGMVGPSSFAEEVQKLFHEITDSREPMGWDNQLENEPVVNISYTRKHRIQPGTMQSGWSWELIPHYGFSLGNMEISAGGGGLVRFGRSLPANFGPYSLHPGGETALLGGSSQPPARGFNAYAGVNARWVGQWIFLDGNTWRDSHSLDRDDFTATALLGFAWYSGAFQTSFTMFWPTGLAEDGQDDTVYGSLAVSWQL